MNIPYSPIQYTENLNIFKMKSISFLKKRGVENAKQMIEAHWKEYSSKVIVVIFGG